MPFRAVRVRSAPLRAVHSGVLLPFCSHPTGRRPREPTPTRTRRSRTEVHDPTVEEPRLGPPSFLGLPQPTPRAHYRRHVSARVNAGIAWKAINKQTTRS
jgi:hypothetical protein